MKPDIRQESDTVEETKSAPVQPGEPARVNINVSELDATIMDRVKSQPKSIEEIEVMSLPKPQLGRHRLSIPDELKEYETRFAFCWVFKNKRAIDEACTQYHWVLCNRSYFSDIPNHLFSVNGGIEQGDMILAFRSKKIDSEMRKAPGLESAQIIKTRTEAHKDDPAFYIPKSDEYEVGPDGKRKLVPIVGV